MEKYQIKKWGRDFRVIKEEPITQGTRKKVLAITAKKEMVMFKYEHDDYTCSEACSEKMAYEIAKILGYNCARVELAIDNEGRLGVLNYYFTNKIDTTHTDIIAFLNKDVKERKEYYTISNIKSVLDNIDKSLFRNFIKIMIFDALIGEQDRHEENWGISQITSKICISPLYDNGDSLLREFKDNNYAQKYYDGLKDFDTFIQKSKTLIYKENHKNKYKHFELIKYLYDNYPQYTSLEISNLKKLTDKKIIDVVTKVPDDLLTSKHKEYIIKYLIKRRDMLLNIR